MSLSPLLTRLDRLASLPQIIKKAYTSEIEKAKIYLRQGQQPPKGFQTKKGPKGGIYYETQDKTKNIGGKIHKLADGPAVTKKEFEGIKAHHLSQGAKSVEFVPVEGRAKNLNGKYLYHAYVHHGDEKPRTRSHTVEHNWKQDKKGNLETAHYVRNKDGKYVKYGKLRIEPWKHGANLYHVSEDGTKRRLGKAYGIQYTGRTETEIDEPRSRAKNIKGLQKEAGHLDAHRINTLADNQARLDKEKAEKPKKEYKPEKDPMYELKSFMRANRKNLKQKPRLALPPGTSSVPLLPPGKEPEAPKLKIKPDFSQKKPPLALPAGKPVQKKERAKAPKGGKLSGTFTDRPGAERAEKKLKAEGKLTQIVESLKGKMPIFKLYTIKDGEKRYLNRTGIKGDTIRLHHDTSIKRPWLRSYTSKDDTDNNPETRLYGGELIQPHERGEDFQTFRFTGDGLYQAQGSGDYRHRYFHVKEGKVHELDKDSWNRLADALPTESHEVLLDQMRHHTTEQTKGKLEAAISKNRPKIVIGGNTFNNKDWIKSTFPGWQYDGRTKTWSIPKPDDDQMEAFQKELKRRGLNHMEMIQDRKPIDLSGLTPNSPLARAKAREAAGDTSWEDANNRAMFGDRNVSDQYMQERQGMYQEKPKGSSKGSSVKPKNLGKNFPDDFIEYPGGPDERIKQFKRGAGTAQV